MTKQDLLDALTVERYNNTWWTTREPRADPDNDLTVARRRRELRAAVESVAPIEAAQ